jgi:hypothetical protein
LNATKERFAMSLKEKPHFTLSAAALADWIESQPDRWWGVDGDRHLMSVVDFPCPGDELAPVIRKVGKDLLVYDRTPGSRARGERIGADRLTGLADTDNWKHQMTFLMSWVDSDEEWLLVEDEALVEVDG